ncbi:MAG TPA: chemotaxis protein CheB, partial [Planctomycetota bacterium]|nr:chemotaxis protein CheB [Planctomycetota bacterium]
MNQEEKRVDLPSEAPAHVDPPVPGVNPPVAGREPADRSLPFQVVCLGASAGGLEAYRAFFEALPPKTGMAFVVVAHLAPEHQSMMPEILQRSSGMRVAQVEDNQPIRPDHVYVIPPGKSLVMADGMLQLSPRVEVRGLHLPIDLFMRSLAEHQGHKAIGVILSGTANDGTLGMEEIQAAGGITFAQDDTAEQTSMPRSVMAAGCADFVLPPAEIAKEIERISKHPYVQHDVENLEFPRKDPAILRVLELLRKASGVDFAHYKYNTLQRRITRRMVLHKLQNLSEYIRMLTAENKEVEAL